jgi:cysteine-rich repeat protein
VFYEDTSKVPSYKTGDLDAAEDYVWAGQDVLACGNGVVEIGETCDDGNGVPGDGCDGLCQLEVAPPFCGDGSADAGEECDDGNMTSGDGCSAMCVVEAPAPFCGDGSINAGEECDDGNTASGDGCSAECFVEGPECGDGSVDAGEQCDDGNQLSGDGCSMTCEVEPEPDIVVTSAVVGDNGSLRLRGRVEPGESVVADHAAVVCRTRGRGAWACSGRSIEPGTAVNILLQQP